MSDMIDKEGKRTRDDEEKREEDPPDSVKKKSRGPSDCLNWDDDSDEEMEFVPFTQPRPVPVVEPIKKQQTPASILDRAQSWEMVVDLKRKLVFPSVVQTTQRPDMVIWWQRTSVWCWLNSQFLGSRDVMRRWRARPGSRRR